MRRTTAYRNIILILVGCLLVLLSRAFGNPLDTFSQAAVNTAAKVIEVASLEGGMALLLMTMFAFWTALELATWSPAHDRPSACEQESAMALLNNSATPVESDSSRKIAA